MKSFPKPNIPPQDSINTEQKVSFNQRQSKISANDAVMLAIRILLEQKGLDVRGLDLRGISDISDYFVLVSGTSDRHVCGMADKVKLALLAGGEKPHSISGYENAEWILMDYGDFVIHLFYEPIRQYYEFDSLWEKAKTLPLPADLQPLARTLRTGLFF